MASADRPKLPPAYRFIVFLLRPFLRSALKQDFGGLENLPAEGGLVVCVNHLSHFDPLTVSLFLYENGYPPFFLAKEALFRVPVLGRLLAGAGQIPVYRESGQAAGAYRAAVAGIAEGKTIVILPEGTLTRDPDLWPMVGKTGAARVALQTRCPVVPVAQWGPQDVLAPYAKVMKLFPRKTIHVLAGPPVELSDLYDQPVDVATLREATTRIMNAITALLERLRGETGAGRAFRPAAGRRPASPETRGRRDRDEGCSHGQRQLGHRVRRHARRCRHRRRRLGSAPGGRRPDQPGQQRGLPARHTAAHGAARDRRRRGGPGRPRSRRAGRPVPDPARQPQGLDRADPGRRRGGVAHEGRRAGHDDADERGHHRGGPCRAAARCRAVGTQPRQGDRQQAAGRQRRRVCRRAALPTGSPRRA